MIAGFIGGVVAAVKGAIKAVVLLLLLVGFVTWAKTHPEQAQRAFDQVMGGLAALVPKLVDGVVQLVTGLLTFVTGLAGG